MTALSTHSAEWGEYYVSRPSQQVDSSPFISFFSRLHIYLPLNVFTQNRLTGRISEKTIVSAA
jgi:hypothetical protein